MVNSLVIVSLATSGLGLWEIVTGRPLFGGARWPLNARATRWGGAYTLAVSLGVAALAISFPAGVAFMTYGILVLAFAAIVQLTKMRQSRT